MIFLDKINNKFNNNKITIITNKFCLLNTQEYGTEVIRTTVIA